MYQAYKLNELSSTTNQENHTSSQMNTLIATNLVPRKIEVNLLTEGTVTFRKIQEIDNSSELKYVFRARLV